MQKRTVLVTGATGTLGTHLVRQLADFDVIGAGTRPPASDGPARFHCLDLEHEASCRQLVEILRESRANAVVHLAFARDPVFSHVHPKRAWQINVAGTARVLEAIAETNRNGGQVNQFIMPSSALAYGPGSGRPVTEEARLTADGFLFALHKRESDEAVQYWAPTLGGCSSYVLRPCAYTGLGTQGYLLNLLRGVPLGIGKLARSWRERGRRLQVVLPFGQTYLETPFQFVHVEDTARLIGWILRHPKGGQEFTVLNVTGRGEALPLKRCIDLAEQKVFRLPGFHRVALEKLWNLGLSSIPPEALPYLFQSPLADTSRLHEFLGDDYRKVIQFTMEDALRSTFAPALAAEAAEAVLVR